MHGAAGPAATVFNIDATSGSHFTSCDQCHAAKLIDPNRKNSEFDFTQASCDSCHLPAGPNSIVDEHNAFGVTISGPYVAGNLNTAPKVGRDIWDIPTGYDYTNNLLCLGCHAGNVTATLSTPLVFRLSDHDSSGCMGDQRIADANGGNHRVDQSRDGVPICFVCHNATMGSGTTPWARDWAVASCATCHGSTQTPTTC